MRSKVLTADNREDGCLLECWSILTDVSEEHSASIMKVMSDDYDEGSKLL
jgi:hypothetical protein